MCALENVSIHLKTIAFEDYCWCLDDFSRFCRVRSTAFLFLPSITAGSGAACTSCLSFCVCVRWGTALCSWGSEHAKLDHFWVGKVKGILKEFGGATVSENVRRKRREHKIMASLGTFCLTLIYLSSVFQNQTGLFEVSFGRRTTRTNSQNIKPSNHPPPSQSHNHLNHSQHDETVTKPPKSPNHATNMAIVALEPQWWTYQLYELSRM